MPTDYQCRRPGNGVYTSLKTAGVLRVFHLQSSNLVLEKKGDTTKIRMGPDTNYFVIFELLDWDAVFS